METLKTYWVKRALAVILTVVVVCCAFVPAMSSQRVNPLRFGEDKKSWQLTLNISRYVNSLTAKAINSSGLWEKKKTFNGTTYNLRSSFEINKRIGIRGGVSYRNDQVISKETNLWTGTTKTSETTESHFGGASLKVKVNIWDNSYLKTHFLIPVLGGSAGVGLIWSKDPLMVFPKFTIDDRGFDISTGVSFVANSKIALTGRLAFSKEEKSSLLGFGGGVVYRRGEYDGLQVSASLKRGESVHVSLDVGLSYGEEE